MVRQNKRFPRRFHRWFDFCRGTDASEVEILGCLLRALNKLARSANLEHDSLQLRRARPANKAPSEAKSLPPKKINDQPATNLAEALRVRRFLNRTTGLLS
jgi:hypothetical protein